MSAANLAGGPPRWPERATLAPDKNRDAKASMLIGAEVEPGLYKFRLWTACSAAQNPMLCA